MNSLIRSCILVLLITVVLATSFTTNGTSLDELRRPRVVGRIVKLYSGSKTEPIACAGEGYQADINDCAVFYRCIKGAKEKYTVFRFQCGPGTIYDPDTEVCNHPKSTKRSECFSSAQETRVQTEINDENEIDFSKSQELPSPIKINKAIYAAHNAVKRNDISVTTVNPLKTTSKTLVLYKKTQNPNQQGDACTTDGFMGDSDNCRKFYRCVGNGRGSYIRYEFSCSETTVWDDEVQSCNHPASVKRRRCGRGADEDNIANKADPQNTPDGDAETIQQQTQINYGSNASQLQVQINNGSAIQNQTQINYGERVNQSQRQENYGSESKQNQTQTSKGSAISQSQTQINHGNNAVQSQVQIDHTKQTSQTQTQQSTPDNDDDNGYNNQNDGQEKPQDSQVTESNAANSNSKQCTSSGFMGDPDNCKKFYRCVDNGKGGYTRYEFSCGDGTVWDSSIEGCNHAWAVSKCNEKVPVDFSTSSTEASSAVTTVAPTKTTSRPETTTQASTTDDDDDNDNGYGNQNQGSPLTTTSKKPTNAPQVTTEGTSASDETVCTHSGFIGDTSDCKKFYRCVDNGRGSYTKYEFSCGDGTVWDPEIEACNHAWAVEKCGRADNTDFNKEETTTQRESSSEVPVTSRPTTENSETENNYNDNGYGQPEETAAPVSIATTESQQTQAPESSSNNKCTSSGFMGDDNDCKKFYRCVDDGKGSYTRYEFSCGEGTVWDQSIEGCNHDWAVKRCGGNVDTQTQPQTEATNQETSTASIVTSGDDDNQGYNPPTATTENTSTTQSSESSDKPAKGKECTEEGFFGNEDDCRKFYRCVDNGKGGYTKYEFTCGEGTVWDSEIQGCNHPSDKNQCSSNAVTSSSTTGPSSDPDRENDEIYTETTSKSTTTTTETSQPNTTEGSQTSSGMCESEGFHPNPNDCKKFYRCVDDGNGGYTKYDFTCGDGTVWDQNIQGCNHESKSKDCKSSSSNTDGQQNHETTSQQIQENTTEGPKTTQGGTSAESQATTSAHGNQGQCTSDGFYANPSDCKKFYRCVSDGEGGYTRYDFICGEGTVWVQEIQACDHDNDVHSCSSENSGESSTSSSQTTEQSNIDDTNQQSSSNPSTSTQSQAQTDDYTESPSSSSSTTASSAQCTSEGFYPNENDCTKFYRCIDNGNGGYKKYDFTCGEGTAWDSNIQACNHKNQVDSCNGSGQEKPETQPLQDDGVETTQSTTSTTTSSDSSSMTTTSTSGPCTNDSDSERPSSEDKCTKEGYFGNSQDCTKFYRCVDNGNGGFTKYDFQCGEGTIWDQDITACNHPGDVNNPSCNNQGQNSDSSSSTTSTTSSQEESSSATQSSTQSTSSTTDNNNQSSSNCSQETSSKKPGKSQVNCTKAGFYPDPDDCKKFYRCVDWDGNSERFSVFHFDCGEGTIWDPQLDTCNYEDSIYPPRDCSGKETQSETVEETKTTTEGTTTTKKSSTTTELQQSSTTEQQSTTQETTTQTSTTSEPTTTEQSTSEQTTTTTEPTTIPESTTSEKTTTEQSTSEQTTTLQSTTSEQTTTEQSTTSQQTTTEQSTTTQQTTTEQPTTQQTTTEQQTTSEQTTTEQSSTTEQSTTEQPTTTKQSTTTEQTTTQQSTTSEESTTTQSTATEETTTQQSTTEQSTTDSSTTQEPTTQEISTTEASTEQTTTEQSSSKPDKCPETDEDQYLYVCPTGFRRHPKYCNLFYQCTEDDDTHEVKVATFTCPNNTIYDEKKTQCVEESKADKKCDGQIAQKRRVKRLDAYTKEPMVVSKEKHNCPAVGHFPFERQDECSPAFLKCERSKAGKVRGFVYQCPDGFVYWAVSRRCEPMSSMRSCKQTTNNWSGRWEIPVERRNVAP